MEKVIERLVSVKSFVTMLLTVVFADLAVKGAISGEQFLTIFTVIISFYFGVTAEKRNSKESKPDETDTRI